MKHASIDAKNVTIRELLKEFYDVPEYQREYVWQTSSGRSAKGKQVDQFIQDVWGSFDVDGDRSYFIGSCVVGVREGSARLEVIDGQQRLTTITILLCALKYHLQNKLKKRGIRQLDDNIRYPITSEDGKEQDQLRLLLSYPGGAEMLEVFESGGDLPQLAKNLSPTVVNLVNAYKACLSFAEDELKNEEDVSGFYKHLMDEVYVVRIVTPNAAKALQIFETITDRGATLDAMDLLKNLRNYPLRKAEIRVGC